MSDNPQPKTVYLVTYSGWEYSTVYAVLTDEAAARELARNGMDLDVEDFELDDPADIARVQRKWPPPVKQAWPKEVSDE